MSYQLTTIVGRVGQDAQLRSTNNSQVASFSVAVAEKVGEREYTTWFRVAAWGKLADIVNANIRKGMLVFIAGRISARAYANKSGEPTASLELTAETIRFIGNGRPEAMATATGTDADIPF